MLPPSVNHYVEHGFRRGKPYHAKTPEALAWERDVAMFLRGEFVTGLRFAAQLRFRMGPGQGFDVDNLNKCTLDSVANAGAIRDAKGKWLSDRHFKTLHVEILDLPEHRALGAQTEITIEAIA